MFRMPPRKNCSVHPIIDSEDTFKLMEEAISLAKSYIYMAYWDLQTDLKTMSSDLRRRGINNWTDLLIDAAKRGVTVRILLNDFDPDFSHNFHHDSWKSYNRLMVKSEEARIIYRADMSRFQVICSMHEAKLPPDNLMLLLLTSAERSIMESEINEIASRHGLTAALSVIRNMPRIWDIIERDKSGKFRIEKFRP